MLWCFHSEEEKAWLYHFMTFLHHESESHESGYRITAVAKKWLSRDLMAVNPTYVSHCISLPFRNSVVNLVLWMETFFAYVKISLHCFWLVSLFMYLSLPPVLCPYSFSYHRCKFQSRAVFLPFLFYHWFGFVFCFLFWSSLLKKKESVFSRWFSLPILSTACMSHC